MYICMYVGMYVWVTGWALPIGVKFCIAVQPDLGQVFYFGG